MNQMQAESGVHEEHSGVGTLVYTCRACSSKILTTAITGHARRWAIEQTADPVLRCMDLLALFFTNVLIPQYWIGFNKAGHHLDTLGIIGDSQIYTPIA